MHWYDKDGKPRYDAGMREARKEGLLPSITSIDKVIASPGLEQYKLKQLLMSAQTLTRLPGETDDQHMGRVKRDADEHRRQAAKLGTVVHHLIERYLSGKELFFTGQRDDVWDIYYLANWWIDENIDEVYDVEVIGVDTFYAGKADAIVEINGDIYILDWKTVNPAGKLKKDGTPGKGKMAFPSHCRQLAALKECLPVTQWARCMNVYISSNPDIPGVWTHEWSRDELEKGLEEFYHALDLWYSTNNYEVAV